MDDFLRKEIIKIALGKGGNVIVSTEETLTIVIYLPFKRNITLYYLRS